MNLKVDGFRLCAAFSKLLCSPEELLLSLQIPCWYLFIEKQLHLSRTASDSELVSNHALKLGWLLFSKIHGSTGRNPRANTACWLLKAQPVTLGVTAWGFQSSFHQRCLLVCVARALNVCLPPCGLLLSEAQHHLCLLLRYNFSQVAGAKQVMTERYSWF